jgi:hypothetical protein
MTGLDHPPYSPGLSPRDCWLFGLLRNGIKENVFRNANEVEDFICNVWSEMTLDKAPLVFHE